MKNLLALATALTILMPVTGAFAASQNAPAATHKAVSTASKKMKAAKSGMSQTKHKKARKHSAQDKAAPAAPQH